MKPINLNQTHHDDDIRHMLKQPGAIEYRVIEHHGTPVRPVYYRVSEGVQHY